ncbi:uncharacterized protein LOC141820076 [Curcuma longa]|uniref:uncharacterized protein LOC141820076 n=1 Tax=Curcuma longa TaxID=136217 RepID=UPI003D9EAAE5
MSHNVEHFSGEGVIGEPSPEEQTNPQSPPPPSPPLPPAASAPNDDSDFKRVGKMAYTWAIALLAISVTLLLTNPYSIDHADRVVLYAASTALAFLSLIAAVGLIYYSILSHPGAQLAKVQKKMMGFSGVTLVLSVLSRLALLIPFLLFLTIITSMILFAGLLLLLIYLAHKIKATHEKGT